MKNKIFSSIAVACMALAGCAGNNSVTEYSIPVDGGTLTLIPMADNAIRVRMTGEYTRDLEDVIYTEKVKTPSFKVSESSDQIVVATKAMSAVYDKATSSLSFLDASGKVLVKEVPGTAGLETASVQGFAAYSAKASFESPEDEFLYGTGQFQDGYLNVRGLTRRLTQVNTQISLPFILSNKGYGMLWNNTGRTDFNPADSTVAMVPKDTESGPFTVNATGTSGNRREVRFTSDFEGTLIVPESGSYSLLLDVGQKMARRHYLAVDGEPVIDMRNMWLPPTSSIIVDLEAGEHTLSVEGVRGDNPTVYWRKVTDETTFSSPVAQALDYTVFAGSADEIISTYRTLTGPVPEMPDWMFGYIHCRERYHSQGEILATASEFKDRDIPLDVIVQDWQWWGSTGWNSMEFDPEHYANPKSLTDSLHDMNAHLMLSVWSKIDKPSTLGKQFEEKGYYIPETDWVDFFNPEAADFYWENFRDKLVKPFGIDVWWLDATEPENDDLDGRMVNNGTMPGAFYRNAYPTFVVRTVYEGMLRDTPDRTPVILTRSAFPGMQRYGAVTWSGDVGNDYKTLKYQIIGGLGQNAAGLPWWTYDAGGFFRPGNQYTDEAYQERMLRWLQTSVFLPFMRVHGYMSNTEPWNYSEDTYGKFVECINVRKALQPYVVKTAKAVSKDGYTMMRPLVFDFSEDTEALKQDCEYMFGPSLLVCPVTEANVTEMKVYLPQYEKGWVSIIDGTKYDGGQYVTVPVSAEMIPVFAKVDKAKEFSKVSSLFSSPRPGMTYGKKIDFDSCTWDFGTVDDNAGTVSHEYWFVNSSSKPVRLGEVAISCSCLNAAFPKDIIDPGKQASIELSFMPAGAAGPVVRSAEVFSVDGTHLATLTMTAEVNRIDADIEDLYHVVVSPEILVDRGDVPFGFMYHGQTLSKIVRLANTSYETVSLKAVSEDPGSMLEIECPEEIGPRSEEEMLLTYRIPDDETLFGTSQDEFRLLVNGQPSTNTIKASCIYMSPIPEGTMKPSLWTNPSIVKLSKGIFGGRYSGKLLMGNSGDSDLHILAVNAPDSEVSLRSGTVIKPGKELSVKASSMNKSFSVEVFCDDPVRPYKELIFNN